MIRPPRSILFATDFSGRCDRPLDRALRLAGLWQAKLILLHVIEAARADLPEAERRAEEARAAARLRAEAGDSPVEIEVRIVEGPVAATIAEVAESAEADLIVTGVARYNRLGDFVLGTTVDRLLRRSHTPILVVKERARSDYRSILVATDFSDCSATALETAAGFFPTASLALAHAYRVPLEPLLGRETGAPALQAKIALQLDEFVEQLHLPPEIRDGIAFHIDYGETEPVLSYLAGEMAADLAVIGAHGRSGFTAATIGSTAKALLEALPCDVLLVRDEPP